ncbi:hypothetical protein CB0940_05224 [Cercospora beticola]|uniref:Pentatricopeptide repeat-containing protein n=2 Tax=Cercospora beticola TaxID=122368 RepID=A0A2G5HKV3_CERBT|nr:hypothetical protein CB0940_05224 [Cercospora beticola]PIA93160.1 hypothetical protein CB0940_05224 [Cercospora beticola]
MPSCTRSLRTLCRSRLLFAKQNHDRLPQWRRLYSTSNTTADPQPDSRRNELPPDLNHVSADSTYLDFILGANDDELPGQRPVSHQSHTPLDSELEREQELPTAPAARQQRRTRRAQVAGRAHESHDPSREKVRQSSARSSEPQKPYWIAFNFRSGPEPRAALPKKPTSFNGRRTRGATQHPMRRGPVDVLRPLRERPAIVAMQKARFDELRWVENAHQLRNCIIEQREPVLPVLSAQTIELVDRVYDVLAQNPSAPQRLRFLDFRTHTHWPSVALWFMHYDPATALDFLLLTNCAPGPHNVYTKKTLQVLTTIYYKSKDHDSLEKLANALPSLTYSSRYGGKAIFTHGFVYRALTNYCTDEALSALYDDMKKHHYARVNWRTWLRFAASFSKREKGAQALDALFETKNAGADVDGEEFYKVCSTLLRRAVSFPGGLRACVRIVESLLKLGLTLNNTIANIIMLNAVEARDLNTAMEIYHSLRDHGLQPDAYTFAILLKGCKTRIDNAEMLNETIRDAISGINVLEAPVVATEILHCLALHHTKHNLNKAFLTVADAYAQLFSLGPLRLVGLLPEKLSQIDDTTRRPQPRPQDISIMLATYLEQSASISDSTTRAYDLWQRVKHAIESGQEPFASMIQTDHIFNAFLGSFTKTKQGLLHAAEIIKYMQLPNEPNAKYQQIRPTVQTWSIFVHGFSRHGQLHLADQILAYMRGKGIEPNQVTYNSLLVGYAARQDLDGVLSTVQRMETDGHTWDAWTNSALRRFRDQDTLRTRLRNEGEVSPIASFMDFTPDLKRNLETKIESFEPIGVVAANEQEKESVNRASGVDVREASTQQTSAIRNETGKGHVEVEAPQTNATGHETEEQRIARQYFDDDD